MKSRKLPRYHAPARGESPACAACRAFVPECVYQGRALCWLCAHHIVDHGCSLHAAPMGECECLPEAIYPEESNILELARSARAENTLGAEPAERVQPDADRVDGVVLIRHHGKLVGVETAGDLSPTGRSKRRARA